MLISFLLPTRKRIKMLITSINSILNNCVDTNCFEILLAFDEDDTDTLEEYREEYKNNNWNYKHVIIVTERFYYIGLHKYYNKLCEIAKGTHLWLWNDDAEILTKNWDIILEKNINILDKQYPYYFIDFPNNHSTFILPLITRNFYDIQGYYSNCPNNDSWLTHIMNQLNCGFKINIELYHSRHDSSNQLEYDNRNELEDDMTNIFNTFENMKTRYLVCEKMKKLGYNWSYNLLSRNRLTKYLIDKYILLNYITINLERKLIFKCFDLLAYHYKKLDNMYKKLDEPIKIITTYKPNTIMLTVITTNSLNETRSLDSWNDIAKFNNINIQIIFVDVIQPGIIKLESYPNLCITYINTYHLQYINECVGYNIAIKFSLSDKIVLTNTSIIPRGNIYRNVIDNLTDSHYLVYDIYQKEGDNINWIQSKKINNKYHLLTAITKNNFIKIGGFDLDYSLGEKYGDISFIVKIVNFLKLNINNITNIQGEMIYTNNYFNTLNFYVNKVIYDIKELYISCYRDYPNTKKIESILTNYNPAILHVKHL